MTFTIIKLRFECRGLEDMTRKAEYPEVNREKYSRLHIFEL